jgi:hypothetical protein
VPAAPESRREDPTGVGDAFRAGFLAGLSWRLPLERCAQIGSMVATYVLEHVGTQEYDLDVDDFLERLGTVYGAEAAAEVGAHGTGVPERSDAADRPVAEASAQAPDEGGTEPRSRGAARARRVFERYGLPGLAALGPLLTGVHIAAVVALAAGARRRPMLAWLAGGVVVWAIVAAGATLLGIESLVDPDALPDLFSAPPR